MKTLADELGEEEGGEDEGAAVLVATEEPRKGFGMKRLEYLGAKAGIEDVQAHLRYLKAAIEYCQGGDEE
jgi:hypothetical protein